MMKSYKSEFLLETRGFIIHLLYRYSNMTNMENSISLQLVCPNHSF